ncbi:DegQ family serine endoprotease [Candidatus Desantisbacteria bacterium]|nr:DegQ family serine endoprotease [Candidatus Desantisbacteria bacterium]
MWIKSKKFEYTLLIIVCVTLGGLIGVGFGAHKYISGCMSKLNIEKTEHRPGAKDAVSLQDAFVNVAEVVSPCVVNLSVEKTVRDNGGSFPGFEFRGTPFEDFFKDFFGGGNSPREFKDQSLGTGFIVDSRGYILTNNHVVKGADVITVCLLDGRKFKGKIVGTDPKVDLALIKIDVSDSLPTARLGNSSKTKIGEWVIAIGNPFGLEHTITVGVISAKGRSLGQQAQYENFIQTDASINPGNSGGPLVNIYGEVIGINTAIVAGGQGIGFAIPVDIVKHTINSLIKHGKVTHAWLGIYIQDIDDTLAKHFKVNPMSGVLVADVMKDSPAEKAGIKRGDIITTVNREKVSAPSDLQSKILEKDVGEKVEVTVLRDGKEDIYNIVLEEMTNDGEGSGLSAGEHGWRGMTLQNITPEIASEFKLPSQTQGVIITRIEPRTPAAEAQIQKGDVLVGMNNESIDSLDEFNKTVKQIQDTEDVMLVIKREGHTFFVGLSGR